MPRPLFCTALVLLPLAGCASTHAKGTVASADAGADAGEECRGQGRYESGKEGSYRPCCAGLTEVFYQQASYVNGVPACDSPPLRIYACVRGTCGDGICEPGEAPSCGCVADCPSAAWPPLDAGARD